MKLTKKISAVVLAVLMIVVAVFAVMTRKQMNQPHQQQRLKLLTLNFQAKNTLSVLTKSSLNSKKNVTNFLKK